MRLNKYASSARAMAIASGVLMLAATPCFAATLFVTSERDNTVTVLDSNTLAVKKVIDVGTRPRGIAITPDHREIFVCIGDDDRMDVIDTKTLTVSRNVPNVLDPELVAIDPVGKRVYAANEEDSQVTVIDRASGKIVGTVGVGA
jgi:YVTN family beta-propeller protein